MKYRFKSTILFLLIFLMGAKSPEKSPVSLKDRINLDDAIEISGKEFDEFSHYCERFNLKYDGRITNICGKECRSQAKIEATCQKLLPGATGI